MLNIFDILERNESLKKSIHIFDTLYHERKKIIKLNLKIKIKKTLSH